MGHWGIWPNNQMLQYMAAPPPIWFKCLEVYLTHLRDQYHEEVVSTRADLH